MKNLMVIGSVMLAICFVSCHKKPSVTVPTCIMDKIEAIKSQAKWNPPATVEEYRFEDKRVFLFSSPCCDRYNEVFDEYCNFICAPTGGYTGKGDGKCASFKDAAQFVKVVWKDERQ